MQTSNRPRKAAADVTDNRTDLRLATWLLAATGAAALGHQLLWTRRMMDLLGGSAESTVRVFVCFFLGLSLGSAFAALAIKRISRPWRFLAFVELSVALTCVPILLLPYWADLIWPVVGPERLVSASGALIKTGLSLALLVPPTFLMGMTLPIIVSVVCIANDGLSRQALRLYAVNTAGGVVGLVIVTGIAIHKLGVGGSMILLITINAMVALKCYRRSRLGEPVHSTSNEVEPAKGQPKWPMQLRLTLAIAAFSGAGVMALEVLTLQLVDLAVPTSFYPPAMVLFCVILLLAEATLLAPKVAQRFGSPQRLLAPSLATAAVVITLIPVIFFSFTKTRTADVAYSQTFTEFLGRMGGFTLLTAGPAVLFCGLVFPLTLCLCSGGGRVAGRKLALLLAVNGIGGVVGAEFARSILLPSFGVHVALGVIGVVYALAALAVGPLAKENRFLSLAIPLMGLVIAGTITAKQLTSLPLFFWDNAYQVIQVRPGREGVLTVFEREGFGRGLSFNNQYLLGGSGSLGDEQRQSHIPLLLHPSPERVCFAGLASGITASGALKHSAVKSITAVEISQLVVDAAARHFGEFNDHIDKQTNVTIHVEDARTYIASCKNQFDVIIGDLFIPWQPGEAGLASLEYFKASKEALRPSGVFCQWFAMHQLTEDQFNSIVATFRTVFPQAYVFRNHFKTGNLPLALIGFKDTTLDWAVVSRRCAMEREAGRLRDPLCRHPEGLAMLYFGALDGPVPAGRLNTLGNLFLELDAGLNLVVDRPGQFYAYADDGNPWPSFVKSRMAAWPSDKSVPEQYRTLLNTGFLVTQLEIAKEGELPAARSFEQNLRIQFPEGVRSDAGADWSLWAGTPSTLKFRKQ